MNDFNLVLAAARRVNYAAVAVFDGVRLFDLVRLKVTSEVRLAERLDRLVRFYGAAALVLESDAGTRFGSNTAHVPVTAYDSATIRHTILPSFTHGDLDRLNRVLIERYPELTRFVRVNAKNRTVTANRPEHIAVLAAVALGLADALIRRDD